MTSRGCVLLISIFGLSTTKPLLISEQNYGKYCECTIDSHTHLPLGINNIIIMHNEFGTLWCYLFTHIA